MPSPESICKYCGFEIVMEDWDSYLDDLHDYYVMYLCDVEKMLEFSCPMCIIWWTQINLWFTDDSRFASRISQICNLICILEKLNIKYTKTPPTPQLNL